jgi:hypothetical protein
VSDFRLDIRVDADLECEFDGCTIMITASDGLFIVDVPDLSTGYRLIRRSVRVKKLRLALRRGSHLLRAIGSTLELRLSGVCIATLGGSRKMMLGRELGFSGIFVRPIDLVRAILRGEKRGQVR